MDQLDAAGIRQWQTQPFSKEIPLLDAVEAIRSPSPRNVSALTEVRLTPKGRALLYSSEQNAVAVFCHAGVFSWSTPLDTGNLVPNGRRAPVGLAADRIQRSASFKCEISFAFDTRVDYSLYTLTKAFEPLVEKKENFNLEGRDRTMWQNGSDTRRFIMTCPMFSSTKYRRRVEPPYKVHHWITDALKDSKDWFPNPDRTTYLHYDKGELKDISEFEPGDVVWVSFTMTYSVGPKAWGPEFRPIEMIKVGTAFRELDDIPSVSRARLELGPVDLPMTDLEYGAVNFPADSEEHNSTNQATSSSVAEIMSENALNEVDSQDSDLTDDGHSDNSIAMRNKAKLTVAVQEKRKAIIDTDSEDEGGNEGGKAADGSPGPEPELKKPRLTRNKAKGKGKAS